MTEEPHYRSQAELQLSRHANEVRVSFIYDNEEQAQAALRELNAFRAMHGALSIVVFDNNVIEQNNNPGKVN